jgi:hypothetical protein
MFEQKVYLRRQKSGILIREINEDHTKEYIQRRMVYVYTDKAGSFQRATINHDNKRYEVYPCCPYPLIPVSGVFGWCLNLDMAEHGKVLELRAQASAVRRERSTLQTVATSKRLQTTTNVHTVVIEGGMDALFHRLSEETKAIARSKKSDYNRRVYVYTTSEPNVFVWGFFEINPAIVTALKLGPFTCWEIEGRYWGKDKK